MPNEWKAIAYLPGFEINRGGDVRRIGGGPLLTKLQGKRTSTPYVNAHTSRGFRTGSVNVLLEETFGPGAAEVAGLPKPDLERVRNSRKARTVGRKPHGRRVCHDCGRPTNNYRCDRCWKIIRGEPDRTVSPMDPDFV